MECLSDSPEVANKSNVKTKRNWYLYFSIIIADALLFTNGYMLVWTSSVIPKLRSNDTDINPYGRPITTMEESLLASVTIVICPVASVTMTNLPNQIGRKGAMAAVAVGIILSLGAVAYANNLIVLITAVTVIGFCRGTSYTVIVQYNKELSHQTNRGRLGVIIAVVNPLGNVYGFIVGPFTSVSVFTLLCGLPAVIYIIFHAFIPESPAYLISKGRKADAIKVLEKLRPNDRPAEIEKSYEILEANVHDRRKTKNDYLKIFKSKCSRKAITICCMAVLIQELSGITAFLAFAAPMFNDVKTGLPGYTVAIIIGVVKVFSAILASYTVEKLGRRFLLLFSSISCGLVLFVLGVCLYLQQNHAHLTEHLRWLPILCVAAYFVLFAIGIGSVGYALLNDFFSVEMIGTAFAYYATVLGLMMFIELFTFPIINKYLGACYSVWFFSFGCFVGFLYYYFCLFETKGKSYAEIRDLLSK